MNIESILRCLKEELTDISTNRNNVHYTNIYRLYEILCGGYLEGQIYKTKSDKCSEAHREICTARPTACYFIEKYKPANLSGGIDNVKIILFTDRILFGLRGFKRAKLLNFMWQAIKK